MNRQYVSRITLLTLLSAVLLAYQISLLQLLSFMQWSHFALLIISIAMLGYGCAGTVLSLFRKVLLSNESGVLPFLLFLTASTMLVSVPLIQMKWFAFDSLLMFTNWREPLRFIATALCLMFPFLFGGLISSILLSSHTKSVSKLYCWIMVGSGVGGVLAISLATLLMPNQVVTILSSLLFTLLFFLTPRKKLALFGVVVAFLFWNFPPTILCSQFKSMRKVQSMPGSVTKEMRPTSEGILHTMYAPALRTAPCHSLFFDGIVPVYPMFFLSGEMIGPDITPGDISLGNVYQASPDQAPYIVSKRKKILILSGAPAVVHGVVNDPQHIDMVEPNGVLASKYHNSFDTLGMVSVHHSGKRSFLHNSKKKYDLIVLPSPNSFGGTSGLYSLNENRLLTREAFYDYREHLTDTGAIVITWWHDYPPKAGLRLLTLVTTYLREFNEDPETHVRLIQNWGAVTALISNSPLSSKQHQKLKMFCREHHFDLLSGNKEHSKSPIHSGDSLFLTGMESILSGDSSFISDYSYLLRMPVDDRPFFNHYIKTFSPKALKAHCTMPGVHLRDQGYLVSIASVLILGGAAFLLIVLPLLKLRSLGSRSTFFYFALIGSGFMFVELSLVHALSSYLTSPLYAMSIVITSLLIGSGVGSLFWGRMKQYASQLPIIIGGVLIFYTVFMGKFLDFTIGIPFLIRVLITITITFIPGFFMGGPFPLRLKILSQRKPDEVPWAIGINSCFSVLSAALATLIAVEFGFSGLLLVAAALYILLLLVE